jgi:hypothetical protein
LVPCRSGKPSSGKPVETLKPRLGALGFRRRQQPELAQHFDLFEPGVGDLGGIEEQKVELGQPLEMLQSRIGRLSAPQARRSGSRKCRLLSLAITPSSFHVKVLRRLWPHHLRSRIALLGVPQDAFHGH